jgi:hypothetical protein
LFPSNILKVCKADNGLTVHTKENKVLDGYDIVLMAIGRLPNINIGLEHAKVQVCRFTFAKFNSFFINNSFLARWDWPHPCGQIPKYIKSKYLRTWRCLWESSFNASRYRSRYYSCLLAQLFTSFLLYPQEDDWQSVYSGINQMPFLIMRISLP